MSVFEAPTPREFVVVSRSAYAVSRVTFLIREFTISPQIQAFSWISKKDSLLLSVRNEFNHRIHEKTILLIAFVQLG